MPNKLGDEMSADKVRAAQNKLDLENPEDLNGRHVEAICRRGGGKFHGYIKVVKGRYFLKSMNLAIVREKMAQELKETGFVPKPRYEDSAWSSSTLAAEENKPEEAVAREEKKPKSSRRNRRYHFQVIQGGLTAAS